MLKYLVYCQVFWVEAQRLQDQCISIWALVFYNCISNKLPREKTNANVTLVFAKITKFLHFCKYNKVFANIFSNKI